MDSAIIWNTNTKNIHKYKKMNEVENKKKTCAGQYTVDLINNNIRRNVQEDVQTGCTGCLHSSNMNGRKIINNLLIISDY